MNPTTETTCVQDQASPDLNVKEPTGNHHLVPLDQSLGLTPSLDQFPQLPTLPAPRVRLGKIARLPRQYRDMVNRMLRNNISARKIVDALEEVGITVTQRNISNWKTRGGYEQCCLEEDRAAEIRLHQDNLLQYLRKDQASQIPEVGLQLAASHISRFLLQPHAIQQLVADPEKYTRVVAALCRVSGQIHTLQKYRDECARSLGWKHNPELVRRESEREIESVRESYTSTPPVKSSDDPIPHRNFMPGAGISERPLDTPKDLRQRELEASKRTADLLRLFNQKANDPTRGSTGLHSSTP